MLPAQTYVKGFLRSYAEYLGLDGQLYVDEFNSRYVRGEVEEEAPLAPRGGGPGWGGRQSPMATSAVLVVLGIVGVAAALVIVAWRFGAEPAPNVPLPGNALTPPPAKKQAAPVARLVASAAPGKNALLAVYRGSARRQADLRGHARRRAVAPVHGRQALGLRLRAGQPAAEAERPFRRRPGTGHRRAALVARDAEAASRSRRTPVEPPSSGRRHRQRADAGRASGRQRAVSRTRAGGARARAGADHRGRGPAGGAGGRARGRSPGRPAGHLGRAGPDA